MASPTGSDVACDPTRIVSGAIHHLDHGRSQHAHGRKNEWDVLASAFRRYLRGAGVAKGSFHFTDAPGVCPVATPVDFTQVRAIAYQYGLPVHGHPSSEVDVVKIHLAAQDWMFFLAERDQARELELAWRDRGTGGPQEALAWAATVHTGNLHQMTWLTVSFGRIQGLTRDPLP